MVTETETETQGELGRLGLQRPAGSRRGEQGEKARHGGNAERSRGNRRRHNAKQTGPRGGVRARAGPGDAASLWAVRGEGDGCSAVVSG